MNIEDYSIGGDSFQNNHIVVFANQKGGVGKTTICAHFANYLANFRKVPVLVIDADLQHSLLDQREDDLKRIEGKPPYIIQGLSLTNPQNVKTFMEYCKGLPGTVLVDAPGNLSQEGLEEVFVASEFIFVPFYYDINSIRSTRTFVLTILKLCKKHPNMKPHLVFFCNRKRKGVGKGDEVSQWKLLDKFFSQFGKVVDPIGEYQDIVRYNTIESSKSVVEHLKVRFDDFYHIIYNIKEEDDD